MRESPAPLNIPTPTPAPDRGGPVACLNVPGSVRFFVACVGLIIVFLLFMLGLKWFINAWDGFRYYFGHFWGTFQTLTK